MYLYAISLPGNIEKEVNKRRRMVFSNYGVISPYAFPTVIPLCVSPLSPEDTPGIEKIRRSFIPSIASGTVDSTIIPEGAIHYYPVKIAGWGSLMDLFSRINPVSTVTDLPELFRERNGMLIPEGSLIFSDPCIFMGSRREIKEDISGHDYRLKISWKRGDIVCLSIKMPFNDNWWEYSVFD